MLCNISQVQGMSKEKGEGRSPGKDFVFFQNKRKIINLCKFFLLSLEDIRDEYNMSDQVYEKNRKRILDYGNDTIRELEENLEKFEFTLK